MKNLKVKINGDPFGKPERISQLTPEYRTHIFKEAKIFLEGRRGTLEITIESERRNAGGRPVSSASEVYVLNPGEHHADGLRLEETGIARVDFESWSHSFGGWHDDLHRDSAIVRFQEGNLLLIEWRETIKNLCSGKVRFIGRQIDETTYRGNLIGGACWGESNQYPAAEMLRKEMGLNPQEQSECQKLSPALEGQTFLRRVSDGWLIEEL